MKSNPGGTITGSAIIGRDSELHQIWQKLDKRSIVLSAERRVGKTSLLRKMKEYPRKGWTPILVLVESARHPIDCVEAIYNEACASQVLSTKGVWAKRVTEAYKKLAESEIAGFKLPKIQADWRRMLKLLVQDIVENCDDAVVLMIDEFPFMVWNIADDHGAALAMQFLDALREIRQQFEPSNKIRFILSGSIGFHLVLQHLKLDHGYKGAPTNDMFLFVLGGMAPEDTESMCRNYLDDEHIRRKTPEAVAQRMQFRTDGLPLYIQYVCEAIQDSNQRSVEPADIDRILDEMLRNRHVTWFRDAAQRIDGYYAKLELNETASIVLNRLSREEDFFSEAELFNTVRTKWPEDEDSDLLRLLELLTDDNYVVRDTSSGERRYRFRYRLMREWWKINRA